MITGLFNNNSSAGISSAALSKVCLFGFLLSMNSVTYAQEINRGATEKTPSRAEYFTWINNTNEGTTEGQTLINLDFFDWLRREYGMKLDIYAFDSGVFDGKNYYGSNLSPWYKRKFPNGFRAVADKAAGGGTRLGLWGGPDGFGDTEASAKARTELMVSLCRDFNWALFKFDMVCGPLRPEKENYFIDMMRQCRSYCPDLILLNHRLGLETAEKYATTFLWEGRESYIDVNSKNTTTAPHNRAGAMARGLVPGMKRLTEDHGVCFSSCLDYWDDELVLHAFGRSLILAPEIYGNPWLLSDREFPRLARLFNLHRKFNTLLVNGMPLPESYGNDAVSRGDDSTRIIVLKNLSWTPRKVTLRLDDEIGLKAQGSIKCRLYHPTDRLLGTYRYGDSLELTVLPFRSLLLSASADESLDGPGVEGVDFDVVRDVKDKPMELRLLGFPGTRTAIRLNNMAGFNRITIDGRDVTARLSKGRRFEIAFPGTKPGEAYHRLIGGMTKVPVPSDAQTLYEATVFAADNNAMEVRSLRRSGETKIPQVKAARDAFFNQSTFVNRGICDRNMFDGNMHTVFGINKYKGGSKIKGGCFRLDLGSVIPVDSIIFRVSSQYMLQPLYRAEGNFADISADLCKWDTITYIADTVSIIKVNRPMRYLRLNPYPDAIAELEVYAGGKKLNADAFRASNLFADASAMKCVNAWNKTFRLDEIARNCYLCIAVNGRHGIEGAYAALKVDGQYVGAPARALSYPANPWENVTAKSDSNYTYYFPLNQSMVGKKIEAFVLGYEARATDLKPEIWITAYPIPYEEKTMIVYR